MRKHQLFKLRLDRKGVAAVEFAIMAPVLIGLLVPMVDLGMGLYAQMQVANAAQVGAEYTARHGWDSAAIQNAVTSATNLTSIGASPAPSKSCGCPGSTSVTFVSCTTICSGGAVPGTYVTVNAQATYTPILPYPALGNSLTLSSQTLVRIQ